ncbi:MAG: hypothetical protein ACLSHC_05010 [Bilophila wadsworthia]
MEDLVCLLHPSDLAIVHERMKAVSSLTGCDCLSVRMRHNDGTWRQVEARVVVLRAGPVNRIIGAPGDITPKAVRISCRSSPRRFILDGLYTLEAGQAIIEKPSHRPQPAGSSSWISATSTRSSSVTAIAGRTFLQHAGASSATSPARTMFPSTAAPVRSSCLRISTSPSVR